MPAAKNMCWGEMLPKKLDLVFLSESTDSQRIQDLADKVKSIVIQRNQRSKFFAIQLDKRTDVTNFSQLMMYARCELEQSFKEEFLFCESLSARTNATNILRKVDDFMTRNEQKWRDFVGVSADGAAAMTGKHRELLL